MAGDKAPPAHPPYVTMVAAAIKALKERTGSSSKAIGKYIGTNYKVPAGFEKTLSQQLKRLAASGKLVKVKASFKLSEALKVRRTWIGEAEGLQAGGQAAGFLSANSCRCLRHRRRSTTVLPAACLWNAEGAQEAQEGGQGKH